MKSDRSKALIMSHEQKSKRILQHCSSWTQLDDTKANRGIIHGQGIANLLSLLVVNPGRYSPCFVSILRERKVCHHATARMSCVDFRMSHAIIEPFQMNGYLKSSLECFVMPSVIFVSALIRGSPLLGRIATRKSISAVIVKRWSISEIY